MNRLPKILADIVQDVQHKPLPESNLTGFMADWQLYLERAKNRVPDLVIADNGETVVLGTCSPGCLTCKQGLWDCVFLTMRCNLSCPFCYSPLRSVESSLWSAFGDDREQIAAGYAKTNIQGVSFSGGEPFSHPDELLDWVAWARKRFPDCYLWVYTNGTMVQPKTIEYLAMIGLDEIRFNTAATGYDNPSIIASISHAARWITAVTIEIPAIPKDTQKLLNSLQTYIKAGVRYLNLHEILYEPGTLSEHMQGDHMEVRLPDGHVSSIDPGSRELILSVMEYVNQHGLSLSVNHCSLVNKLHQVHGRRKSLLPLTQTPFERLTANDLLESYLLYSRDGKTFHCHPDQYPELQSRHPDWQAARVARTAPLSLQDQGRWVLCEFISTECNQSIHFT